MGQKEQAARTLNRRQVVERRNQQIEDLLREILEKSERSRAALPARAAGPGVGTDAPGHPELSGAPALAPDCQPARQGLIDLGVPPGQLPPESAATLDGPHR